MPQPDWKPSPSLAKETAAILQYFANQFPRAHLFYSWTNSPATQSATITTWARQLVDVSLSAIVDAAQRWMGDPNHIITNSRTTIPTAATFGKYAKQVDRQFHRAHVPMGPKPAGLPGRAHELSQRARKHLPSYAAVALVYDELLKLAPDKAAAERIQQSRIGKLPEDPWPREEHFDEAVEVVRAKLERRAARDAAQLPAQRRVS